MKTVVTKSGIMSAFGMFVFIMIIISGNLVFAQLPPEAGVCARVRIRINQDIAIARTAFVATLEVRNSSHDIAMEGFAVSIDVKDEYGENRDGRFLVKEPVKTGVTDISGNGTIYPGNDATITWTIIPTRDAAQDGPVQYYVSGNMTYSESGTSVDIPLFPAPIMVKPDPLLTLDYFLVHDVYSDDPFTPESEPAEPFPLGLILSNRGKGAAHQVKITSSQPEIIENEKGLLIDFKIIGAQVNTDPVAPSLTVNMGDVGPAQTSVARWMMTSSLQGKFQDYTAEFKHIDGIGEARISLIDSVSIHELIHAVRVDVPADDHKPDFLVNDVEDADHAPDTLYNSDGSTDAVNIGTNPSMSGTISAANLEASLTATAPTGWIYIQADDPGREQFRLKQVIRSDGREIRLGENAWTTHRTMRFVGQDPYREHKLHIFDYSNGVNNAYTLIYENPQENPKPPNLQFIPSQSGAIGHPILLTVKASDPNETIPTITANSLPTGASFSDAGNGSGVLEWTPGLDQEGEYEVRFTASDGALTDEQAVPFMIEAMLDTDNDGMADDWELRYFLDLERDGTGDFDEDGVSDLVEFQKGDDPIHLSDISKADLNDVITGLQALVGIKVVCRLPDIDNNSKIDIREVIRALQALSD